MSPEAQEAVGSLSTGPGGNLLPHATSCHVKLPRTAPSYRNLSQLPAATWQDAAWHEQAEHQTWALLSQGNPVHCRSTSSPGALLTLDHARVWTNQCHYQDADTEPFLL